MMAGKSASHVPPIKNDNAVGLINEHLQDLRKKHNESVSQCKSLNKEHQESDTTMDCIDELEKLLEKASKEAAPHVMFGSFQVPLDGSSMSASKPVQPKKSVPKLKPGRSRTKESRRSLVEPNDKSRYLCITDGFVICCLDLKHSKDESMDNSSSAPQPVTKISTLKLLEEGLPASIGLFKLGSNVYMIGGQEFPKFKKDPNMWGMKLYHDLYKRHGVKGSSCDIFRVSLANNGSLSLCECNDIIRPMNKPKSWPIIEKIDGQLHVIESLPFVFGYHCPDTIPSHEVLDLSDPARGWIELKPGLSPEDEEFDLHVWSHSVIGNQIYANAHRIMDQYLAFDTKTNKWELHDKHDRCGYIKNMADIEFNLEWGGARFLPREESIDPLYVVITVEEDTYPVRKKGLKAYLVTQEGKAISHQFLRDVLEGFKQPFSVSQGTLFKVDDKGKTMCVILQVNVEEGCREGFLFISIFNMEEVAGARSLLEAGEWGEKNHYGTDFVKVVVKQRCVYKTEGYLGAEGDIGDSVRLGACFL